MLLKSLNVLHKEYVPATTFRKGNDSNQFSILLEFKCMEFKVIAPKLPVKNQHPQKKKKQPQTEF